MWDWGDDIARTRRTSLIIDPPDGRLPPLTPDAQRRREESSAHRIEHPADGPEDRLLRERCIVWDGNNDAGAGPPMMPASYNNNFQIVQTEDYDLLLKEMVHETRIVPLDGRPHLPANVRQWLGSSRAYWEDDMLVIETTNLTGKTNYMGAVVLFAAASGVAHHSFLAEVDPDQPIQLRGTLTQIKLINQNSWFHIDVVSESGEVES